jgi:uncharacterized protein (DUF2141 family)
VRWSFLILLINMLVTTSWAAVLKIDFQNMRSDEGDILYLVFNTSNGYPDKDEKSFRKGKLSAKEAKEKGLSLGDIPDGKYVMTFIHDENSNNKLDKNFLGMPKEGFAFSNNPKVFMGPPSYNRCEFKVSGETALKIRLKYF